MTNNNISIEEIFLYIREKLKRARSSVHVVISFFSLLAIGS